MTWVFLVWTLAAGGTVEVQPHGGGRTLDECLAARAAMEWRVADRPAGTGTLVGACRPILTGAGKPAKGRA